MTAKTSSIGRVLNALAGFALLLVWGHVYGQGNSIEAVNVSAQSGGRILVRVTMKDGRVVEERQPHLRGGHREPLTRADIEEKFRANCGHGKWDPARTEAWLAFARDAFDGPVDLKAFRG